MNRIWTEKQLEAIETEGDLLVSAAAGAGKTAVLTERIARLISSGVGVDQLLVVTFTRAAAAEMKDRIGKRLAELSDEAAAEGRNERAASLRRAAASCESANISTIHSFCISVLHRYYHEVGLDPAFRVAEELEAELLAKKALDEVLEEQYQNNEREKDAGFSALLAAVGNDSGLETLILSLYRFAIARPDPEAWLDSAVKNYTVAFRSAAEACAADLMERVCGELELFMDTAKALRLGPASDHPHIAEALDDDMSFMLSLILNRDLDKWVNAIARFAFLRLTWKPGTDEDEKAEVKAYRDSIRKYYLDLKKRFAHTMAEEERFSALLSPPVECLKRLTDEFAARYAAFKQEEGLIDFSDMEQLTLKILKNERIADEYRSRFHSVFIDEYQDINPAQEAILSAVSRSNRFMVGDVKQSIYRFRQAEPAIFLEKYRNYRGLDGNIRIDLNSNFRSRPAVLDAANMLFSALMRGDTVGEIDYSDNAALVSGFGPAEGAPNGSVELVLIDPDLEKQYEPDEGEADDAADDSADDSSNAALQASYAARRILEIMASETLQEGGSQRRYRFSDFTVLLRSAAPVAFEWLKALSEAGIPCVSDSGPGFFDAIEVRLFIDILRVIDNRRQDVPLLAVMRSPIFGFTDEEIVHVKTDYDGGDVLDHVLAAAEDTAAPPWSVKCRAMLGRIDDWRSRADIAELPELISGVLDETRFSVYVSALYGGEVRSSNLSALTDISGKFADAGRGSLSAFIRFLDESRDSSPKKAEISPDTDAVRLMTIHHSKGLEFPVVILGDVTKSFNRAANSAVGIFDAELGIGLCSVAGDRKNKSLLQRAITFRELRRQNAEEMRMLYVAQTRAKEKLIMLGVKKKAQKYADKLARPMDGVRVMNAPSYADWMLGAYFPRGVDTPAVFPNGGGLALEICGPDGSRSARIGMSEEAFETWQQEAAFLDTDELERRFRTDYPFDADTKLPSKLSVTGLTLSPQSVSSLPRFMADEEELDGAYIGSLTHRLLKLCSIRTHTEETIKSELDSLTRRGLFTPREAEAVRLPAVVSFFASDIGRRMAASPRVEREREFNVIMEASALTDSASDSPILLQGVIDCCFIEDGEWVLVDHKTTHVDRNRTPRTVAERYRRQLELYAAALNRLTGIRVKEGFIYLLSVNEAVKLF